MFLLLSITVTVLVFIYTQHHKATVSIQFELFEWKTMSNSKNAAKQVRGSKWGGGGQKMACKLCISANIIADPSDYTSGLVF